MNILIYGGKGWIGNQFVEYLKTKKSNFILGDSRVDDEKRLEEEIKTLKPSNIISLLEEHTV